MQQLKHLLFFIIFGNLISNAQNVSYTPEMVLGNRSIAYQHFVGYTFNDKWSINNVSLFDTEPTDNKNNIFFMRNMLIYKLNRYFNIGAAIGVKNPGKFGTLSVQYFYAIKELTISYSIGSTYQNRFTLEQNFILNYSPTLIKNIQAYLHLFVVVNTNLKILDRGIQQLRIGVKNERFITGIAVNLDQFTKAEKTLENIGIFIKYNF